MIYNLLCLALGGASGALARHFVGAGVLHFTGWQGHWGTFLVNVSGCMIIGFVATWVGLYANWGLALRYFFFTGFLGSYTTFSTYMLENFLLLEKGAVTAGLFHMVGSVVLGFLGLWAGIYLARLSL